MIALGGLLNRMDGCIQGVLLCFIGQRETEREWGQRDSYVVGHLVACFDLNTTWVYVCYKV